MKLFSTSELIDKAKLAFKRFPFALIWAILSAITSIIIININDDALFDECLNLTLTMVLGVSWLIATQFYIEQFKKKKLQWLKLIIFLLLIGSYFLLPVYDPDTANTNNTPYIRWTLFLITGHLTLFFAPFITVWHPKAYWNYLKNMMIAIIRSGLFSGILYIGLVIAMSAVEALFEVHFQDIRYGQLFILCLGIINTWVYLSDFPKEIQHNIHLNFHKAIEVFVKFILIPLALLYIVILYAYVLKIVIEWELPEGWVSYLITALATLLFIIQFIIHPVRLTHESRLIKRFTTYAFWLLLPLLILLYIAIYTRVTAYGITEARYFLILVSVFITGATLYFLLSRKKQLRYVPMVLAIFALLGSFGFWGAFSVSTRSQVQQFKEVYQTITKKDSLNLSSEDKNRFSSVARYLYEKGEITKINPIVGFDLNAAFPKTYSWSIGDKILDSLGYTVDYCTYSHTGNYHYEVLENEVKNISGYDFMQHTYFTDYRSKKDSLSGYNYYLKSDHILIQNGNRDLLKVSLKNLIATLPRDSTSYYNTLNIDQLTVEAAHDSLAFKFLFDHINVSGSIEEGYDISSAEASVLIKNLQ